MHVRARKWSRPTELRGLSVSMAARVTGLLILAALLLASGPGPARAEDWVIWALKNQRKELAVDEPMNWIMALQTHNAYNSAAYGYLDPNQRLSFTSQFDRGVRALELDPVYHPDFNQVILCHGVPPGWGGPGICSAPNSPDLGYNRALGEIAAWLYANPDEVIMIAHDEWSQHKVHPEWKVDEILEFQLSGFFGHTLYRPADFVDVLPDCLAPDPIGFPAQHNWEIYDRCSRPIPNKGYPDRAACVAGLTAANVSFTFTATDTFTGEIVTYEVGPGELCASDAVYRVNHQELKWCEDQRGSGRGPSACNELHFRTPTRWPTLRELRANRKQVIVVGGHSGARPVPNPVGFNEPAVLGRAPSIWVPRSGRCGTNLPPTAGESSCDSADKPYSPPVLSPAARKPLGGSDDENLGFFDFSWPGGCKTRPNLTIILRTFFPPTEITLHSWHPWDTNPWLDNSLNPFRPAYWTADPLNWTRVREDRSFSTEVAVELGAAVPIGVLNSARVQGLAECNVTLIALDMLDRAGSTFLDVCSNAATGAFGGGQVSDPCPNPDRRTEAAVWSWRNGDVGDKGYALSAGRFPTARWTSRDPEETHECACGVERSGDPSRWGDTLDHGWKVSFEKGTWQECFQLCDALNQPPGATRWVFAAPVNGSAYMALKSEAAFNGDVFVNQDREIWLGYHQTPSGRWVTTRGQDQPPVVWLTLNQAAFKPDETLRVALHATNPGRAVTVDVYLGAILPTGCGPGDPMIAFVKEGGGDFIVTCASEPQTFTAFQRSVQIPAGMPVTVIPDIFRVLWPADAPAGPYVFFLVLTQAGALADGRLETSEIIAFAPARLTFAGTTTSAAQE